MIAAVTNHLWQSTLFALAAALLSLAFRRNRAAVRFWLWFSASAKFLVPLALLMSLGSRVELPPAHVKIVPASIPVAMVEISEPFVTAMPVAPSTPRDHDGIPIVVWACGFAAVTGMRLRGWLRVRAVVRVSTRFDGAGAERTPGIELNPSDGAGIQPARRGRNRLRHQVRFSSSLLEPGVVGVFRPILLLPAGIEERLTSEQLAAVLNHELCHIRRRDNLLAAFHMIVEALFWFHPLVWWIGSRLIVERERACDDEVLRLGSEPRVYAEGILNVCRLYVESPVACVAGVTGADLRKRVEAILSHRSALGLNFARRAILVAAGVVAVALPVVVGMLHVRAARAQSAPAPKFEVASVKPCKDGDAGGRGGRGSGSNQSPGRVDLPCRTVHDLIQSAYLVYANGETHLLDPMVVPIEGGPGWINTEHYQISAKAEGAATTEMLRGPMMQALLADRFQLKIRRETREVAAFDLTAAKGGPKLHATEPGSCVDIHTRPLPPPGDPASRICGSSRSRRRGLNVTWEVAGMSLGDYCKLLSFGLGRPVIDKIGLAGQFDFRLTYWPDESLTSFLNRPQPDGQFMDEPLAPTIFTALEEQLGLKLGASRGPKEFLVIEHVERPTEN